MILHLNKLKFPPYPRMLCAKFDWNWPSGFGKENKNVKSLQWQQQQTTVRTNFDQKSSPEFPLRWAKKRYKPHVNFQLYSKRIQLQIVPNDTLLDFHLFCFTTESISVYVHVLVMVLWELNSSMCNVRNILFISNRKYLEKLAFSKYCHVIIVYEGSLCMYFIVHHLI